MSRVPKPLSKEMILAAQAKTLSNLAASRYLHVSYKHYKKWAKLYDSDEEGKSLFEKHLNPSGIGIPKFLKNSKKQPALLDIIEGRVSASSFSPQKLKYRLIEEGYLAEECSVCGFHERRVLDYRMPLMLNFKDRNHNNWSIDNIELLCYNDYFLQIGDVFNKNDEKNLEGLESHMGLSENVNFEVDPYHLERLKELGLDDNTKDKNDGSEFIAYEN